MERLLPNKLRCSELWSHVAPSFLSPHGNMAGSNSNCRDALANERTKPISTCLVACCRGDHLFRDRFVTSPPSACYGALFIMPCTNKTGTVNQRQPAWFNFFFFIFIAWTEMESSRMFFKRKSSLNLLSPHFLQKLKRWEMEVLCFMMKEGKGLWGGFFHPQIHNVSCLARQWDSILKIAIQLRI